jgi:hypothetical protein
VFGETLFSGSRVIFWAIVPAVVITMLLVSMQADWTPARAATVAALDLGGILFILALYNPVRFHWAARVLCAEVFLLYVAYLIHEWVFSTHPFRFAQSTAAASPRNSLLGFVIIGIPSLLYALTGSFRPWARVDPPTDDSDGTG